MQPFTSLRIPGCFVGLFTFVCIRYIPGRLLEPTINTGTAVIPAPKRYHHVKSYSSQMWPVRVAQARRPRAYSHGVHVVLLQLHFHLPHLGAITTCCQSQCSRKANVTSMKGGPSRGVRTSACAALGMAQWGNRMHINRGCR